MTLRYESEVLYDLMKRDGDNNPSDVLPYESELKEKYLEQVTGAYPKLQDYRPEWLNYNLNKYIPSDFPLESVVNVTQATINNVVPYAFGKAILKGRTLVNLLDRNNMGLESLEYTFVDGIFNITTKRNWAKMKFNPALASNKKYILFIGSSVKDCMVFYRLSDEVATLIDHAVNAPIIFTTPSDQIVSISIEFPTTVANGTISYPMLLEYQEGMENWNIPYFEGMKSVQMPVLTTTGKNLFYSTLEYGDFNNSTGIPTNTSPSIIRTKDYNEISSNKMYCITVFNGIAELSTFVLHEYDNDFNYIKSTNSNVFTTSANTKYIKFRFRKRDSSPYTKEELLALSCMITKGNTSPTTYEPYKSNILTVNGDVELRGIGDVKDTLDCLTGELTQRIGEVVLDGSEDWVRRTTEDNKDGFEDTLCFCYRTTNMTEEYGSRPQVLCDRFNYVDLGYNRMGESVSSYKDVTYGNRDIFIRIKRERLETEDLDGFKKWLKTNILTVQYPIEKVIKTVDLSCIDNNGVEVPFRPFEGNMNVETKGAPIQPLLDMTVPVEATTQNLASFIDMGGKENEQLL